VTAPDPFGTADLRRVVLAAWAASPARFREDANAEDLLAAGGYAGRALVELAANGVDAARAESAPARLRIRVIGGELRVANTGAPLTAAGVAGLASLRASAKRDTTGSVGFFGVGFTAVLSWTSAPRVVSTSGGIRFDAAATRAAVHGLSAAVDEELDRREGHVPVLRLPWPADPAEPPPPAGFSTEVRLPLTAAARVEVTDLLTDPDGVEDLLWALPELTEIDLPDRIVRRYAGHDGTVVIDDGDRTGTYRVLTRSGDVPADLLVGRPVEQRGRTRWTVTWIQPLDADPVDVLGGAGAPRHTVGAPTPTDEPLTLPARLVATLPVDDTRRRLAPGPLCDYLLDRAADAYLELVLAADPEGRWRLLPTTGFPAGPVDGDLRAAISRRVEATPLLRTAVGDWVTPGGACSLPGVDAEGAAAIGQAIPELLPPIPPAALAVLRPLGTSTLGWSQVSAALAGLDRAPAFWSGIYRAAADADPRPRPDDLADIPVPLVGGRRAVGARGCLLPSVRTDGNGTGGIDGDLARRIGDVVPDLRVIHPDAVHPLLHRLGATPAEPTAVLADPALSARLGALRHDLEDIDVDPVEVRSVAGVVLDLLAAGGDPAPTVLADLVLTDEDGNPWPAAELLVPAAAIATVLDPEVDQVVVESHWLTRYGADLLVRAGVRDTFPVVTVTEPVPHSLSDRLPDLDEWAEFGRADGPFQALADLDLVDEDGWPQALELIGRDPRARECLAPTAAGPSYSGWWIGRHALVGGRPPGHWRLPAASDLAELYDRLPIDLDAGLARWIGVRTDLAAAAADDPTDLLERLADPGRTIAPARVPRLTAAVVAALAGAVDVDLPDGVRTLSGAVVDAESASVLDDPWWVQVEPPDRLVPGGADPEAVAGVLDLPPVSTLGPGSVRTSGAAPPEAESRWGRAAEAVGLESASVPLTIAADLRVTVTDHDAAPVGWWYAVGRYYSDGSSESLGRLAAWAAGRWSLRHLAVAAAAQDGARLAEAGID